MSKINPEKRLIRLVQIIFFFLTFQTLTLGKLRKGNKIQIRKYC